MNTSVAAAATPRITLGRIGEIVLVGVLTFLCSLPVITMAAAQAAALRALDRRPSGPGEAVGRAEVVAGRGEEVGTPGLTGVYFSALRDLVRRGMVVQVIWLAVAIVAGVDLWFGLSCPAGSLPRTVFCLLGGAGLALVMMIRPFLSARLAADRPEARQRLRDVLRSGVALAGISPWRTMLCLALEVITVITGLATLILLPLVGGIVLAVQVRLLAGAQNRLEYAISRRQRASQPPSTGITAPWM